MESKERVSVAIQKDIHERMAAVAKVLGMGIREATDQAISDWSNKNGPRAQKRAEKLLNPV